MSASVKKNQLFVPFWMMLGPLFIIGTVLAMYIRPVPALLALPFISLGGLVLSYLWRWPGCLASCFFLLGTSTFQLFHFPTLSITWTILLTASFAVSLVVATLFFDEAQTIFEKLTGQSSRADIAFKELEKLSNIKTSSESERQAFIWQLEELKSELSEKKEKLQSSEKLIDIVRKELTTFHSRQETLLQELFESRQQTATFEQQIARLQDENTKVQEAANEVVRSASAMDANRYKNQTEEAKVLHDALIQEMKENVKALIIEKQSLENTLSTLQSECEALALRAKNKSDCLEAQTIEIHTLKTTIGRCDEELRLEKNKNNMLKISYEGNEKKLISLIEDIKAEAQTKEKALLAQQNEQREVLKNELERVVHEKDLLLAQKTELITILEEELQKISKEKESLSHTAKEIENVKEELKKSCEEKALLLIQKTEQITILQEELQKISKEKDLEVQKNEPNSIVNEEEERKRFRELRRIEGLYQQIREQFNEKSNVLGITRRELFETQEKVFSLQKKIEEMEFFGENETEQSLYRIISLTEAELKKHITEFNEEKALLHQLVDVLIKESITKAGII